MNRLLAYLRSIPRPVWVVVAASLVLRTLIALLLPGAGFDEAYYYVYTLYPSLSYFDHPPLVAAVAAVGPLLTGHVSAFTIRIGVLLLFTLTSLAVYAAAREWVGHKDALWSIALFSFTPLFMLGAGVALLPDAPMAFFWSGALLALVRLKDHQHLSAQRWMVAGVLCGLTFLSKYHGVLLMGGIGGYLLLARRREFGRAGVWLGTLGALLCFLPVIVWNMHHGFVSFTFQSGRAAGRGIRFDLLGQAIAGQAAYLGPYAIAPLGGALWWSVRHSVRGGDRLYRFTFWSGAFAVLFFVAVAVTRQILPHWTLGGWIALTIPAGSLLRTGYTRSRRWRWWTWGGGVVTALLFAGVLLHAHYGVLEPLMGGAPTASARRSRADATLDMAGWNEAARAIDSLAAGNSTPFLFTHRWFLSAQIALAVQGRYRVMCFNRRDARGFSIWHRDLDLSGGDGIFICTDRYRADPVQLYGEYFRTIEPLDSLPVLRGGQTAKYVYLYRCRELREPFPLR